MYLCTMKGILLFLPDKQNWVVEYEEENRKVRLEVRPNRIDELNRVGTHLRDMQVVDFKLEISEHFPYRWAVPYIESKDNPTPTQQKKVVKKKRITLWLSGFCTDEIDIECDGYDTSSTGSGYWYFYNNRNGGRDYVGAYPISKTIIHQIEEIEVEI